MHYPPNYRLWVKSEHNKLKMGYIMPREKYNVENILKFSKHMYFT